MGLLDQMCYVWNKNVRALRPWVIVKNWISFCIGPDPSLYDVTLYIRIFIKDECAKICGNLHKTTNIIFSVFFSCLLISIVILGMTSKTCIVLGCKNIINTKKKVSRIRYCNTLALTFFCLVRIWIYTTPINPDYS